MSEAEQYAKAAGRGPKTDQTSKAWTAEYRPLLKSIFKLAAIFWAWKLLLLLVAFASPGDGYDTSTVLMLGKEDPESSSFFAAVLRRLAVRLTRWDGIYFSTLAHRGHVYEQEWAFSPSLARWTSMVTRMLTGHAWPSSIEVILVGSAISHLSHLGAVTSLYMLTYSIMPTRRTTADQIAFTAACLHIFSPAGIFLAASNGESVFAFAAFGGMALYSMYAKAYVLKDSPALGAGAGILLAAEFFARAALVRSNGLLYGIIFLWDVALSAPYAWRLVGGQSRQRYLKALPSLLCGMYLGGWYVADQYSAYTEFCAGDNRRVWCQRVPPSIYTWVQSHYWNNGFLRYWTLSNVPLFLIAAPMLVVMFSTGWIALRHRDSLLQLVQPKSQQDSQDVHARAHDVSSKDAAEHKRLAQKHYYYMMARMAVPQLILTCLCFTSFHIQIINRISSGYPLWYIVLAMVVHAGGDQLSDARQRRRGQHPASTLLDMLRKPTAQWIVRGMVMYAVVQGGLYSSFLPPA